MSNTVNHYAPLLAVLASGQCLLASNVFLCLLSVVDTLLWIMKMMPNEIVVYCGGHTPLCLEEVRASCIWIWDFFLLSFTQIYVTSAVLGSPFWTGLARAMMRNGLDIGKLAVYDTSSLCIWFKDHLTTVEKHTASHSPAYTSATGHISFTETHGTDDQDELHSPTGSRV